MALSVVDPAREQRADKGSSDLVRRQIRGMVIFTIAIAVGMGIYVASVDNAINLSEGGPSIPIVLIPAVLIAILGARLVASRMAKAVRVGDDWLAPLGLEITSMPRIVYKNTGSYDRHDLEGATIMSGLRHGRAVEIVMEAKRYETVVAGSYPEFTVTSTGSGLKASDSTPPPVIDVLGPLRGDRWARLTVAGGPSGIRVRRRVGSRDFKDALWLSDLWLAERLSTELECR